MKVSKKDIDLLALSLKENDLSFIEYKDQDFTIKLAKSSQHDIDSDPLVSVKDQGDLQVTNDVKEKEIKKDNIKELKVPIVGNIYLTKRPETPNFVNVGDTIKKGDVIAIVEAMKIMNEIKAEMDGIVHKICVENGSFVDANTVILELV